MWIKISLHASMWIVEFDGFHKKQDCVLEFLNYEDALEYIKFQIFVDYNNF